MNPPEHKFPETFGNLDVIEKVVIRTIRGWGRPYALTWADVADLAYIAAAPALFAEEQKNDPERHKERVERFLDMLGREPFLVPTLMMEIGKALNNPSKQARARRFILERGFFVGKRPDAELAAMASTLTGEDITAEDIRTARRSIIKEQEKEGEGKSENLPP